MVLTGLRPETIIEIAARALGFWMYQMEQELQYYQYVIKKQSEKATTMETEFINAYTAVNEEKTILKTEKENVTIWFTRNFQLIIVKLSKECEELREKLIIESRTVEKMTTELRYQSRQEEKQIRFHMPESGGRNENQNFPSHFANKANPLFYSMGRQQQQQQQPHQQHQQHQQQRWSTMGAQMGQAGHQNSLHSNPMMISPDSTFGSPSKSAARKTEQANRIWALTQNQLGKPNAGKRMSCHNGRLLIWSFGGIAVEPFDQWSTDYDG